MADPFKRTSSNGPPGLLTTTCRFDADLFARIEAEAERLGVSNSEVIRAYVREGLERRAVERAMTDRFSEHDLRIARLERLVHTLAAQRLSRRPSHD